jgi:hypothetical protein
MALPPIPAFEVKLATAERAMGWLDWSSSLVHSLAWPVAAVIIALLFRVQLRGLLAKVRKLTWGDKAVDFAEELDQLELASRQDTSRSKKEARPRPVHDRFESLLAISPDAAILDAWQPTEMLIDELADSLYAEGERRRGLIQNIDLLLSKGIITPPVARMLTELRKLRNVAAHQGGLSPADAYRFRDIAEEMTGALEEHFTRRPPAAAP